MNLEYLAKAIIIFGIILVVAGILLFFGSKLGIGRLPGDIYVQRGNFTFYFPIATCIILSIILTIIFRLFRR